MADETETQPAEPTEEAADIGLIDDALAGTGSFGGASVHMADVRDGDRDALHILPLGMIPVHTPALRRARLIKNVRLDSVLEFFDYPQTGSGQMDLKAVPKEFNWPTMPPHPDLAMLRALSLLPSYDVYSLRILLRERGIAVNDVEALKLSPAKVQELTEYMTKFTRPLIVEIYGDADMNIQEFEDVVRLFRDPDVKKAREKLGIMAEKLSIRVEELPKFLEDYGDIFLSLSYYRQCLDRIEPGISAFLQTVEVLQGNMQLREDALLMSTCRTLRTRFTDLLLQITGRFETFDKSTQDMWDNISADRFRDVEELIKSYHITIGGVLCALSVKMQAWDRLFPDEDSGGPMKRAEFIMSEMKQGIDKIDKIEASAPMLADQK